MDLTLIVCTHNRADLLRQLLASIASARQPADARTKVLIIANACSDHTEEVLHEARTRFLNAFELQWAREPRQGKSHALNHALDLVSGDAAAFIDDDHRLDPEFLVHATQALEDNPRVSMFCGRIIPDWDGREPNWVHDQGRYRLYPPPIPTFDAGPSTHFCDGNDFKPGGGNLIMRIPLLRSLGLFSADLGPKGHDMGGGEDSEFLKRALDRGERLLYVPAILQFHYVDRSRLRLSRLLHMAFQRSRATSRIYGLREGIPLYLWRKLIAYLANAFFSFSVRRTRFFLIRCAAVLGEMKGLSEAKADN